MLNESSHRQTFLEKVGCQYCKINQLYQVSHFAWRRKETTCI